ncbi:hypothetical protein FGO68_gene1788 [Halteria grandinella]|uniref:Uncharacterized protein n=1 Tax=Halteria grandinella TaxID=5974 RepID=A0A8J8NQS6_HALGN|nr:hypothetical protein FGO68_gene1788 [Halteria grandinella]
MDSTPWAASCTPSSTVSNARTASPDSAIPQTACSPQMTPHSRGIILQVVPKAGRIQLGAFLGGRVGRPCRGHHRRGGRGAGAW